MPLLLGKWAPFIQAFQNYQISVRRFPNKFISLVLSPVVFFSFPETDGFLAFKQSKSSVLYIIHIIHFQKFHLDDWGQMFDVNIKLYPLACFVFRAFAKFMAYDLWLNWKFAKWEIRRSSEKWNNIHIVEWFDSFGVEVINFLFHNVIPTKYFRLCLFNCLNIEHILFLSTVFQTTNHIISFCLGNRLAVSVRISFRNWLLNVHFTWNRPNKTLLKFNMYCRFGFYSLSIVQCRLSSFTIQVYHFIKDKSDEGKMCEIESYFVRFLMSLYANFHPKELRLLLLIDYVDIYSKWEKKKRKIYFSMKYFHLFFPPAIFFRISCVYLTLSLFEIRLKNGDRINLRSVLIKLVWDWIVNSKADSFFKSGFRIIHNNSNNIICLYSMLPLRLTDSIERYEKWERNGIDCEKKLTKIRKKRQKKAFL